MRAFQGPLMIWAGSRPAPDTSLYGARNYSFVAHCQPEDLVRSECMHRSGHHNVSAAAFNIPGEGDGEAIVEPQFLAETSAWHAGI